MDSAIEEITTMIDKLSCTSGDLTDYECLVAMVVNMKPSNLRKIIHNCDIMRLFMAMNLHEAKFMELALRLANTLFSVVPLAELMDKHLSEVLQALSSDKDELVEFVLQKLKDGVCEPEFTVCSLPDELLHNVIRLLVHENLAVYKAATKFLVEVVTRDPVAVDNFFGSKMASSIKELCTSSSNKLRVAEMLVSVATQNPAYISKLESSGLLRLLPEGLLDKDPLTNLNFVELAKSLTVLPEGYSWLEDRGLLDQLSVRLCELNDDPFGHLLMPGYLAFFGCVARQHPVVWIPVDKCSALVAVLSNAIESSDQRISLAAMESVGHIAASADGRKLLRTHLAPTGRLKLLLVKLGRFVQNSETFILLRSVDCVADFLTRPAVLFNTLEAEEQAQISLEWAALIGQPEDSNHAGIESRRSAKILLKRLITLATNPFPDMRLAALRTIRSMATQPWGVRLFLDQPGCMEYLLNRKTEVGLPEVSQLMQTKYDIVKNILTTMDFYKTCEVPEFHVHLRPEQLACLKLYIKEGVWGAQQAQATIAMQSG
ncbi:26S proteasome non-ATPase regulatory subunit 5 [Clonorchis sinensis]|uniref:26S proteasome non-ATPase regulatory subunit 5 n=1 Tax=Clonorchis sinensis TaxID=79923 RepID=A0A8T1MF73_CLOSI|nr:26S proteasome non-ATPase regulatory subunit 5 [Clonorchis sinensis]